MTHQFEFSQPHNAVQLLVENGFEGLGDLLEAVLAKSFLPVLVEEYRGKEFSLSLIKYTRPHEDSLSFSFACIRDSTSSQSEAVVRPASYSSTRRSSSASNWSSASLRTCGGFRLWSSR